MSLHPEANGEIPELTRNVARASFPKPTPPMVLRDELGTLFSDPDFAGLYGMRGQPALSPWRLMVADRLNRPVAQERHAERQPHCLFRGELPATNRSGSCRCKGLRHQRSVKAIGEGVEVVEWLIAGRGQQCGAKIHPSS